MMIEIVGYVASLLIAAAMLFNSIVRLRWFSLTGSAMFAIYGFIIGAYPVAFVNGFIALTNIYFLLKMYSEKEYFRALETSNNDKYLNDYLEFNKDDIQKYYPGFEKQEHDISLLILRNMQVAGVFLADKNDQNIHIKLDYVSPAFRDLKPGRFLYQEYLTSFKDKGFSQLICNSFDKKNNKYLLKQGFREENSNSKPIFVKSIS